MLGELKRMTVERVAQHNSIPNPKFLVAALIGSIFVDLLESRISRDCNDLRRQALQDLNLLLIQIYDMYVIVYELLRTFYSVTVVSLA